MITPTCDCRRGFRKNGQLAWVHHSSADCPGSQPSPPPPRPRTGYDIHAEARRAFRQLKRDLHEAGGNLGAPARHDWPPCTDVITQELTLGDQLELVRDRATHLVQHGYWAAEALRRRAHKLLGGDGTGFTSPTTRMDSMPAEPVGILPPHAVALALARLQPLTPRDVPLTRPLPEDTLAIARDRRLVAWWAALVEGEA